MDLLPLSILLVSLFLVLVLVLGQVFLWSARSLRASAEERVSEMRTLMQQQEERHARELERITTSSSSALAAERASSQELLQTTSDHLATATELALASQRATAERALHGMSLTTQSLSKTLNETAAKLTAENTLAYAQVTRADRAGEGVTGLGKDGNYAVIGGEQLEQDAAIATREEQEAQAAKLLKDFLPDGVRITSNG